MFHVCLNGHAPMRLKYALSPQDYPTGGGWLSLTIREALANARFIGRGGETQALTGLLAYGSAELSSDLMLFYLIHRYGWVSFIVITALFVLFFGKAMRSCARLKSVGGKYVSIAVLLALGPQFVFYCTSNLGFNLFSPLFLPFFSGRAATVIDLGLVGLMLSAFRNDCAEKTVCACPRESRFSLSDGRLIINLNP